MDYECCEEEKRNARRMDNEHILFKGSGPWTIPVQGQVYQDKEGALLVLS